MAGFPVTNGNSALAQAMGVDKVMPTRWRKKHPQMPADLEGAVAYCKAHGLGHRGRREPVPPLGGAELRRNDATAQGVQLPGFNPYDSAIGTGVTNYKEAKDREDTAKAMLAVEMAQLELDERRARLVPREEVKKKLAEMAALFKHAANDHGAEVVKLWFHDNPNATVVESQRVSRAAEAAFKALLERISEMVK